MSFSVDKSIDILERTPRVLDMLLRGISADWSSPNEGGESWSAYDVVGHLIHGELTDWMPRLEIILSESADKRFVPFDRFAQLKKERAETLAQRLDEFSQLRESNLKRLLAKKISTGDLQRTGIHPAFGRVTLQQLLATWAVHDLNHLAQISRVMAKQYKEEVGPWVEYLRILNM